MTHFYRRLLFDPKCVHSPFTPCDLWLAHLLSFLVAPFIVLHGAYWLLHGLLLSLIPGVRLQVFLHPLVYTDPESHKVLARRVEEVDYTWYCTEGVERCRSPFFYHQMEVYVVGGTMQQTELFGSSMGFRFNGCDCGMPAGMDGNPSTRSDMIVGGISGVHIMTIALGRIAVGLLGPFVKLLYFPVFLYLYCKGSEGCKWSCVSQE